MIFKPNAKDSGRSPHSHSIPFTTRLQYEILEDNTADPTGATQQAVLTLEGHTNNVTAIGFQVRIAEGQGRTPIKIMDGSLSHPTSSSSILLRQTA